MLTTKEIFDAVRQAAGDNVVDLYHVTKFEGYAADGRRLEISVLDAGEGSENRFAVTVDETHDDGSRTQIFAGNPDSDLRTALDVTYWHQLRG